ncbi:hypothetical protein AAHC03_025621 [Spirometra sp. Aus1]
MSPASRLKNSTGLKSHGAAGGTLLTNVPPTSTDNCETSAIFYPSFSTPPPNLPRPHKLTQEELAEIERVLTELELELPRRATGFEYAPWQVKDHQRQAKALEAKLNLNIPSTGETRKMLRRVADIIVFLGQDFFNTKEDDIDRPHRYRGNFGKPPRPHIPRTAVTCRTKLLVAAAAARLLARRRQHTLMNRCASRVAGAGRLMASVRKP